MGKLLYLGKAGKLLQEITDALGRRAIVKLPSGVRNRRIIRKDVTAFISAYSIPETNFVDYAKHVESLILRVSKPPLNKQIGRLTKITLPV